MREYAAQVLDLASRSASWAEAYIASQAETPVSFEANRLRSIEAREARGVALRVVVDGRIGFASSSNLDDPHALVDDALATARFGPYSALAYPGSRVEDVSLDIYDPAVEALTVDAMVQMGQQMVDRVRAEGDDILVDADVRRSVATVTVINTTGGLGTYSQTVLAAGVRANRVRGTDMLDVYENEATCHVSTLEREQMVGTVLHKLRLADRVVPISTGALPVIFTPKGVAMTLLAPLQVALSGKTVLEGASPLGERCGEVVFDESFSLADDALVADCPSSAPVDGEGVPTRRTALVEQGRVNAFYYDLQTAGRAGADSTGNGTRGLGSLPSPGTHALRIAPGTVSYASMLADVSEGLLVDQMMGAWAGNPLGGDFAGNVHLGFKVENGRLVGRVKDTMVAGNVYKALAQLQGIGDRAYWFVGAVETPHLYFRSLSVASR